MVLYGTDRGRRASLLAVLILGLLPHPALGQAARWIPPGSPAEDRLRIRQVMGQETTAGYLLRTASVLSPPLDPLEEPIGKGVGWRFEMLPQELHTVWNSDIPFSMNDGALWAGRGVNTLLRAGFRTTYKALDVVFAPEVTHSQNRAFPFFEGADPERSRFSSPWYVGRNSADLPLRFGDQSLTAFNLGQSSVTVAYRSVSGGLSNESMWWGPGVRNALVVSNHAQGIPHVFLRTNRPVHTPLGMLEGRIVVGTLTESLFFDPVRSNDRRSASGGVITLAMPFDPNLTIGLERMVVRPMKKVSSLAPRAADFLVRWDRLNGSARSDHLTAIFGRWIFPESGFEMYVEWSRTEMPGSLRKWLTTPHHTQGYTIGLQWVQLHEPDGAYLRTQLELTGLDQNRVRFEQPEPPDYYTGRAAPQGLTHRGQVLGAAIGPGGSSQWLAVDYLRERWSAGGFLARTRWDNDALFRQTNANFFKHDFSLMTGVRGSFTLGDVEVHGEWTLAKRFNYLFQQGRFNPGGFRTVDVWNNTLDLYLTSRWLGGGE
ncbi:MAG: hypothetical protein O3B84_00185 [Chloroflexi bacterium]|nr:hypothetical protein [Chloroflexota bacterium]